MIFHNDCSGANPDVRCCDICQRYKKKAIHNYIPYRPESPELAESENTCWKLWHLFIYLHKVLFMSESAINIMREYFSSQPVLKAWLFGSYSRGEETVESDIDLLVSFDSTARISLMKLSGMSLDLEELLGREVDIVPEGSLRSYAEASVNRDKILIYERS